VVYLVPALLSLVCLHLMPSVENELVIMFFRAGYFIVPLYLALAVQVSDFRKLSLSRVYTIRCA
jgi:hypothetical protein